MGAPHEVLQHTLYQRAGYESVDNKVTATQVRFFGRVRQANMPMWLAIMKDLLLASEGAPWSIDLSRQYFLRGDKLYFGWRIILQGENIQQHMQAVAAVVQASTPPAPRQADEVRLHAPPNRNALRNGRGAQPTERAIVGPLAKANMGM